MTTHPEIAKLQAELDALPLDELIAFINTYKIQPDYTMMTKQALDTLEEMFIWRRGVFKKLTRKQQQVVLSQFEGNSSYPGSTLNWARAHYEKDFFWYCRDIATKTMYVGMAALALWVVTSPRAIRSTQPSSDCMPSPWGGCTYE